MVKLKYSFVRNSLIIGKAIYLEAVKNHQMDWETYKRLYPGWVLYSEVRLFGPNKYKK